MNPFLLPLSIGIVIGTSLGVLIMGIFAANAKKSLERREELISAWVENNRRLDNGRYYTIENGLVVRHERLKLVKGGKV